MTSSPHEMKPRDPVDDMRCGTCRYWDRINRSHSGDCEHPTFKHSKVIAMPLGGLGLAAPRVTKTSFVCPFWAAPPDHGSPVFLDETP